MDANTDIRSSLKEREFKSVIGPIIAACVGAPSFAIILIGLCAHEPTNNKLLELIRMLILIGFYSFQFFMLLFLIPFDITVDPICRKYNRQNDYYAANKGTYNPIPWFIHVIFEYIMDIVCALLIVQGMFEEGNKALSKDSSKTETENQKGKKKE